MEYYTAVKDNQSQLRVTTDESKRHNVEPKKPDFSEYLLYDCIYTKPQKMPRTVLFRNTQ